MQRGYRHEEALRRCDMKICSECGRPAKPGRETCGAPECQLTRKRKRNAALWRRNSKRYNLNRKLKGAGVEARVASA